MKKVFIAAALLLAGFAGNEAAAQTHKNAVKFNAFGMFAGQYQLAYERALTDQISVQLSGGIVSRNWEIDWGNGSSTQQDRGFVVVPEVRYYFNEGMKGLYGGVFARYKSGTTTNLDNEDNKFYEATRSAIGGGAVIGYQFLIADRMVLDLFAGPQIKATTTKTTIGAELDDIDLKGDSNGIGGRVGLNIGISF